MFKSTADLSELLAPLTAQARALGLTDTEWAARADMRKETLSRLRRRSTCDFATLAALAQVVGARLGVLDAHKPGLTSDGHFPTELSRDYEERLLDLGAAPTLDAQRWVSSGPRFFMAGLAVMLASARDHDRRKFLALAEQLHPGASEPAVFARWLERSPLRPSRFLPLLAHRANRAA